MSGSTAPVHGAPPPAGVAGGARPGRIGLVPPRDWELWGLPRRVVAYVLAVDVAMLLLAAASTIAIPFRQSDLLLGVPVLMVAALYVEATAPIERVRERSRNVPHVDLNSSWTFASALLLHPLLVAVLVAMIYTQRWVRISHHTVYKQTSSAACAVLSAYAAMAVLAVGSRGLGLPAFVDAPRNAAGSGVVLAAGATYLVVNMVLIAIAIKLSQPAARLGDLLPGWEGETMEAATVGLAVLAAWSLADWPAAILLVFAVSYVLHDKILFPQLRFAATTDGMTGLLNHATWCTAAADQLAQSNRNGGSSVILLVDLDHFKRINDRHGHLVGDAVLAAVAGLIPGQLRAGDLVGRFGGEEFVALLPAQTLAGATAAAERIRRHVANCTVEVETPGGSPRPVHITCSIGVALYPDHGRALDQVVAAADRAMYAAKEAGRDQVRVYSGSSG